MIFALWSIGNESQAVWLCQGVGGEEEQVKHMGERIQERARGKERQTKMRKHVLCVCSVKSLLSSISLPWSCRNILLLYMAQPLWPVAPAREGGNICAERGGDFLLPAVGIPCLGSASLPVQFTWFPSPGR